MLTWQDRHFLTGAEKELLAQWNATAHEFPADLCVPELVTRQTEATPDVPAAVAGRHTLSYRELNAGANRLAGHLRSLGVRPNVLVGLCVERSLDLVIGLLGILKAGEHMYRSIRLTRRTAWLLCWKIAAHPCW